MIAGQVVIDAVWDAELRNIFYVDVYLFLSNNGLHGVGFVALVRTAYFVAQHKRSILSPPSVEQVFVFDLDEVLAIDAGKGVTNQGLPSPRLPAMDNHSREQLRPRIYDRVGHPVEQPFLFLLGGAFHDEVEQLGKRLYVTLDRLYAPTFPLIVEGLAPFLIELALPRHIGQLAHRLAQRPAQPH